MLNLNSYVLDYFTFNFLQSMGIVGQYFVKPLKVMFMYMKSTHSGSGYTYAVMYAHVVTCTCTYIVHVTIYAYVHTYVRTCAIDNVTYERGGSLGIDLMMHK